MACDASVVENAPRGNDQHEQPDGRGDQARPDSQQEGTARTYLRRLIHREFLLPTDPGPALNIIYRPIAPGKLGAAASRLASEDSCEWTLASMFPDVLECFGLHSDPLQDFDRPCRPQAAGEEFAVRPIHLDGIAIILSGELSCRGESLSGRPSRSSNFWS